MKETNTHKHLVASLRDSLNVRLLHPGASTGDIIDIYVNVIKAVRFIDPTGATLDAVSTPVRSYLACRKDTVRCIISGLTGDDEESECPRVRTKAGKVLPVYRYTDPERHCNFFPIRCGHASTIYKVQGAQLPHVTIWLDKPRMKAAGYVAMSRVRRDNEYLLGGILRQEHLLPNA